jgi:uncharacterized Fe-S cluster-containing radical SAM superfamily protein
MICAGERRTRGTHQRLWELLSNQGVSFSMQMITRARARFSDPLITAQGEVRASVTPRLLTTVWLNTGTLCNLTCENCYIESSPKNDRLEYLRRGDVRDILEEIREEAMPVAEIGITGGEPFMNPEILGILDDCLSARLPVLVLTNAMRPMMKVADGLARLNDRYPGLLTVRVSIDHFDQTLHEEERGFRSWQPTVDGLIWLARNGFRLHVAARTRWGESEAALRDGFAALFAQLEVDVNASDPNVLVLFPELDETAEVPEITTACWGILDVNPAEMMCASARMVVRRKGVADLEVVACTLLPYESEFSLAGSLKESLRPVPLNHPHCARFCVLGGGRCSG